MAYSIITKDGIQIDNIPDDIPRDDPSLKAKVLEIRQSREATVDDASLDIPTSQNLGTSVGGQQMDLDIPTDENLAPGPQKKPQQLDQQIMKRILGIPGNIVGATEAAGSIGSGILSTLGGTLAGVVKEPFTGEPAEQTAERIQKGLTYTPRTEQGKQITQDVSKALGIFEGLPPYAPVPTKTFPTLTGVQPKGRIPKKGVQTMEELADEATNLYNIADQSGVKFKKPNFVSSMKNISKELRNEEGFTTTGYPKLAGAVKELESIKQPKDFTELQALRKIIKGAARSSDAEEVRLGMKLLNKFDDYLINAPTKDFAVKGTEGLKAWRDARATYSKMKKAEIFEDMIERANLDAEVAPVDRSLRNSLRSLSKDKDTMKFFTPTERNRIKSLVEFEATSPRAYAQRFFSTVGSIAPRFTTGTGLRSGAYGFGAAGEIAQGGLPLTTLGIGAGSKISEILGTQLRKGGIQDLATLARAGGYELAPRRAKFGLILPTGSEYYGTGGLLSNIIDKESR